MPNSANILCPLKVEVTLSVVQWQANSENVTK